MKLTNAVNGVKLARTKGGTAIAFTALEGGKLKELVDIAVIVHRHNMAQVESIHLLLDHIITA